MKVIRLSATSSKRTLEAYAELAAARQDWERSARLLRGGAALFESLNVPIGDQERESYDITVDLCKERLGERAFADLEEEDPRVSY